MSTLIDHLERFCGPLQYGVSREVNGEQLPFHVVRLESSGSSGIQVLSTLGLSNYALESRVSGKTILHELIVVLRIDQPLKSLPAVLVDIGIEAIEAGVAYLRGDVIGPRGPLAEGSELTALYAAIPSCFPDEFHSFVREDGATVVFVWLVPISTEEARIAAEQGWEALEALFERSDPNVLDLERKSMI